MSITFLYKNLINNATKITENSSRPYYGTAYIYDNDLNSVYRGTSGNGTSTVLFDFGSAVYMDSVACISNLTTSGTLVLRAGTISSVGDQVFGIPIETVLAKATSSLVILGIGSGVWMLLVKQQFSNTKLMSVFWAKDYPYLKCPHIHLKIQ